MRFSWRVAAFILVFLAVSASIYATAYDRIRFSPVEWVVREGLAPFQTALARTAHWLEASWERVQGWRRLEETNRHLQEQLAALEQDLLRLHQLERENERLRAALSLARERPGEWVAAEVIARSPNNWLKVVTINRGRVHGLQEGQPVVSAEGLVGRVGLTTARTADVILITHTSSAVGARTEPGGELVLVEGTGSYEEELRVRPLDAHASLSAGEILVTSGLSSIYAPGIPIGRLTRVESEAYGLSQTGYAVPFADLKRLDVVLVLVEPPPEAEEGEG